MFEPIASQLCAPVLPAGVERTGSQHRAFMRRIGYVRRRQWRQRGSVRVAVQLRELMGQHRVTSMVVHHVVHRETNHLRTQQVEAHRQLMSQIVRASSGFVHHLRDCVVVVVPRPLDDLGQQRTLSWVHALVVGTIVAQV